MESILIRNDKFGVVFVRTGASMLVNPVGLVETTINVDYTFSNMADDEDIVERSYLKFQPVIKNLHDLIEAHYDMTGSLDDIDIRITNYYGHADNPTALQIVYDVTIRHGDVEITNEYDECTLLKGLYTKSIFHSSIRRTKMSNIHMFRDTYNEIEILGSYMHSHVPGILLSREYNRCFKEMCLGSASIVKFKRGRKYQDMFMYLAYLDSYIKWESLDGGPYKKISELYSVASDSGLEIKNIDVTDIIYDNADKITAYIDPEGNVAASSDILNHINNDELKCVNIHGCTMKEDGWHIDYLLDADKPRMYECSDVFRDKHLKIRVIPFDNSTMKKYAQSCYKHMPEELGKKVVKRVNELLKLYYEPKSEQTISNLQPEREGETYSN